MPDDDASALDEAGVISAFPDIKVGDIRKIDASTYTAIDVSVGDLLAVHVPSTGPRALAHVTSELVMVPDFDWSPGTLGLSVIEIGPFSATVEVTIVEPSVISGEDPSRRRVVEFGEDA